MLDVLGGALEASFFLLEHPTREPVVMAIKTVIINHFIADDPEAVLILAFLSQARRV
jgi:hypothetical protein